MKPKKCPSHASIAKKELERLDRMVERAQSKMRSSYGEKNPRRIWNHLLLMQGRILLCWKYQLAAFPGKTPLLEKERVNYSLK